MAKPMPRLLRAAALAAAVAALGGCGSTAALLAGEPPVWGSGQRPGALPGIGGRLDWSGVQSEVQGRVTVTARTEEEWQGLWRQVAAPAPGPLPPGWMAVAVFAGVQSGGGFAVEIVDAAVLRRIDFPDTLQVTYRIKAPAAGALTSQELTSPWAVRLVRDTPARPDFERIT
ncbi:protease complex subunit PrcB family protein [Arenibaculum pallidiluteum]|uniref:protease complex subunit PrcB family protein n=1 Tax=Arenibaculum pallidiluteum TaxID=2812559 RepID=UPI001A96D37B|nr:protease complex subunit PrcB family protein [Arenibaculum pallidiluteum]